MKKILSIILCLTVSFTMMIPAFAADENTEPEALITEDELLEVIESEEVQDAFEASGVDTEEIEDAIENGEVIITDDPADLAYSDKLVLLVDEGKWLLSYGTICLLGGTIFNPVAWIIPPAGAALLIAGLPLGILLTIAGLGTIITSPVTALILPGSHFEN